MVWGISTSGNSENVIRGLKRAIKCEAKTIGFAGKDGGKMPGLCDKILAEPPLPKISSLFPFSKHSAIVFAISSMMPAWSNAKGEVSKKQDI